MTPNVDIPLKEPVVSAAAGDAEQLERARIDASTRVPVLIGEGIPLFGKLPCDIQLRHVATQHYPSGLVKSEYEILV